MIDVVHEINAVQRKVASRTLAAGEARTVTISRTYRAPIEDVWDAVTNPERIPRWFAPVSGDLRLGGRYQVEGNAAGVIERCEPPRLFAATWEFGGGVSWIELRLSAAAGQTRLELEHTAHVDDHWTQFGPGAVGVGWDLAVLGLAQHLEVSGERLDPSNAMAWMTSDEGRQFVTQASDDWCQASIAAGAPEDAARAAAARTTAFYTGAPAA